MFYEDITHKFHEACAALIELHLYIYISRIFNKFLNSIYEFIGILADCT